MKKCFLFSLPLVLSAAVSCGNAVPVAKDSDEAYVGFGTVDRSNLAFTVSGAKVTEADEDMFDNVFDYLRGRVPGVVVDNTTSVGEIPHIEIRGRRAIKESDIKEPLFLVDGMEYQDIQNLNPKDIHSVQVLKDAAASAYGSKGADGVIMFTTKAAYEAALQEEALKAERKAARKAARKK
ncbi:MAG: TonB-dependent receptor plug domain-containing protein [Bacteroidales bacterium]|nr:TonB-dependent receptor plug domain-containing protein [Bacteroidales bacterium]